MLIGSLCVYIEYFVQNITLNDLPLLTLDNHGTQFTHFCSLSLFSLYNIQVAFSVNRMFNFNGAYNMAAYSNDSLLNAPTINEVKVQTCRHIIVLITVRSIKLS